MAFNFEEIAQKQDRLLANISEQNRKAYEMFYSPTPTDVVLPQYDETGQLVDVTIPNRAKIKAQMWDDVGAAIGQFDRTFYVDALNGNDTGAGTVSDPFKTVKKAIDSVPVGGSLRLLLQNEQTYTIDSNITVVNKYIQIESIDKTKPNPEIVFASYITTTGVNSLFRMLVGGSFVMYIYNVNIRIGEKSDINAAWSHASAFYPILPTDMLVKMRSSRLRLHQDINNVMFGSFGSYTANITVGITSGTTIENVGYGLIRQVATGTIGLFDDGTNTYTDPLGNALSAAGLLVGVTRDANGVPRNVQSNLVI